MTTHKNTPAAGEVASDGLLADLVKIDNREAQEALEIYSNSQSYYYEFGKVQEDGTVDVFQGEHNELR